MDRFDDVQVRNAIERIFEHSNHGTIDEPTKQGFLELAKRGKDVWNAWYRGQSMPPLYVDFTDFYFLEDLSFDGFEFGDFANFQGATFVGKAHFRNAIFGDAANFIGVCFQDESLFDGAVFGVEAHFSGAQFAFGASFSKSIFGEKASFFGAQYGDESDFDGATFGASCQFEGCNWAVLKLRYGAAYSARKQWAEGQDMSPQKFESMSFRGCKFLGDANFSNREFIGQATWGPLDGSPANFGQVPLFHNSKLHQDTSFEAAVFPGATGSESAARGYRTLKLAFAQQQATRDEQRFFKLEMAEEHQSTREPRRWLYSAYAMFSGYGFSTGRPTVLLLLALLAAWWSYGVLAGYSICIPFASHCTVSRELFEFGLVNAFPLPGLDKYAESLRMQIYSEQTTDAVRLLVTVVVILQKALSLLAFFLIGLALRNLFKMK